MNPTPPPQLKNSKGGKAPSMNATNRLEGKHVNIGAVCRQMSTMETWIQTTEAKGKRIEEKRLNEIQSMEKELKDVEKLMQSLRERYNKHLKKLEAKKEKKAKLEESLQSALLTMSQIGVSQKQEIMNLQRWKTKAVKKLNQSHNQRMSCQASASVIFPKINRGEKPSRTTSRHTGSREKESPAFQGVIPG
mmetsp:Transcript_30789/g.40676  ORF Transcript_30789/g.40676 Transcript_30789/m.40676 type:complete len:191 (+) Transcript_30789:531-1103(+)